MKTKSSAERAKLEDVTFYNNTSFSMQIKEALQSIKYLKDKDPARYHQRLVIEYMRLYPHSRGLLIYHKMGAGKTRLGAAISEGLLKDDPTRKTIFISAKSLHDNFKTELREYLDLVNPGTGADVDAHIAQKYKFVSMNASNMIQQVYRATQKEGLEVFSNVVEKLFAEPPRSPKTKTKARTRDSSDSLDIETTDDQDDQDNRGAGVVNIKKFKEQMDKISALESLDKFNIIIDEAHNFFNSVTNGSRNALALYYMLLYANDAKIIFLTGSPIVNDPFELAVCFNILAGLQDGNLLFGENYNDFTKFFVDPGVVGTNEPRNPMIKNKNKFMDRITGLVSYFGADSVDFKKLLPRAESLQVLRIPMSQKQYSFYISARDKEMEETKRSAGFKSATMSMQKPGGASSSYRVLSRQAGNFLYPDSASKIYRNDKGRIIYEKDIDKLTNEVFDVDQLKKYSTKLLTLLKNLKHHLPINAMRTFPTDKERLARAHGVGPGLVYSQFIDSGVMLIAKALERYGMQGIWSIADLMKPRESGTGPVYRYAIISGDTPGDLEDELKKAYNLPENIDASIIAVLLVTVKGAEGINLFTCRHEHMYEPFWHYARIEQFFDRAIRPGALNMIPEKDRIVYRYIYLADYPKKVEFTEKSGKSKKPGLLTTDELIKKSRDIQSIESTTDVTLYGRAVQNNILRRSFMRALQEGSIDCPEHYGDGGSGITDIKCRLCLPTNKPLYLANMRKDMGIKSPCESMDKEKIQTKSVTIEHVNESGVVSSKEYMYNLDADRKLHIFEFDKKLSGYTEIFANHPDYYEVYKIIKNKEKKL
jgi:SNF2-related domain